VQIKEFWSAPVKFWLALRAVTVVVATLAFLYENANKIFGINQVLSGPWYRYDTFYYVQIVTHGYQSGAITSGFHPLYPWLSKLPYLILGKPILSLMLISSLAGLLLTIAFYQLALKDVAPEQARVATMLFLCWPVAVSLFVPYTEALFLLLAVISIRAARDHKPWLAAIVAAFACLTRQHGLFLALPLAWEILETANYKWQNLRRSWTNILSLCLIPLAYGLWIAYRAIAISDLNPDFSSPQRFIYSVMISSSAYQVFATQEFLPPWVALGRAITTLYRGNVHWSAYADAFFALLFIGVLVIAWRNLRASYRIYCLAIVLVSLSYYTGSLNPYTSLPRHMFVAFPVFIGFAARYKFHRPGFVLAVLSICQQLVLCWFVWQIWVL